MDNQNPKSFIPPEEERIKSKEFLIELRHISRIFRTDGRVFSALDEIDLTVTKGEYLAVIGRSGSGKSTLINMITGIDRPSSGIVYVAGKEIHALNESEAAEWRGRTVGIVFQFFQLIPTLTVLENVMLPMDFCNTYPGEKEKRAKFMLEKVGMEIHADKFPSALSGGERQRVAIARALANDPPLIIADEPTGNLDSKTAESIYAIFESLVAEGKTLIIISHDPNIAARAYRTITLQDGKIAGTSADRIPVVSS